MASELPLAESRHFGRRQVPQWEWCHVLDRKDEDESWLPYDYQVSADIEDSWQQGKFAHLIEIGIRQYQIFFRDQRFPGMVQHDSAHSRTRPVRRRMVDAGSVDMTPDFACDSSCVICLKLFADNPAWPRSTLSCGHMLHSACAQQLAVGNHPCPICKADIDWRTVPGLQDVFGKCYQPEDQQPHQNNPRPARDPELALLAHAQEGDDGKVLWALDNNLDVNCKKDGKTPLVMACMMGHLSTVQLLISRNANIHIATATSRTPLYVAGAWQRLDIVRLLLDCQANPQVRADDGSTVWNMPVVQQELLLRGMQPDIAAMHCDGTCGSKASDSKQKPTPSDDEGKPSEGKIGEA